MTTPSDEEKRFFEWLSKLSPEAAQILSYGEDALRLSTTVRAAIAQGFGGRGWIAFRLDNAESNEHIYEARADAVKDAQRDLKLCGSRCGFVKVPMDDMPPKHARHYIDTLRKFDAAGFRMQDPEQAAIPMLGNRQY